MAGVVPKRQSYAIDNDTTSAKRRRLDNKRRVFVGDGVCKEGTDHDSKIVQLDEISDRISNLPQELLHCILERLSVHDAARTSVLSKEWRCKWGMKNNLVLDDLFFSQLTSNKDKDTHQSAFLRAIESIISVHTGPLVSFNLYIPPKLDQCTVSRWLERFLNKRIRVLEILFSDKNAYDIPLFACEGLVRLKLTTWIQTPLPKLGSFCNLIKVELLNISFNAGISFGSQVKILLLYGCTGIQHLGCQFTDANNLTTLHLHKSEQIEWRWFEHTKQLQGLVLVLTAINPNTTMPVNLLKLLGNTPTISKLLLCSSAVEVLGPCHSKLKGLAPQIESLTLIGIGFHNMCQMLNSLSLIRSLPNLQFLQIVLKPGVKNLNLTVGQRMELQNWKDVLLHQLHTLLIRGVVFDKNVLCFIRVLLLISPSLKVMVLYCNVKPNAYEEISKINGVMRRSPKKSLSARVYLKIPTLQPDGYTLVSV